MADYFYSVENDTANGRVNQQELASEIESSSITNDLTSIAVGDSLVIGFNGNLSSGDETTLDGVVSAHTGSGIYIERTVDRINVQVGNTEDAAVPITPKETALDSFGRFRVSQPTTLFQNAHTVGKEPLIWDEAITGGTSTYDEDESAVRMAVTATGQSVTRQTFRKIQYFKGKSQLIDLTFKHDNPTANVKTEIGFGDDLDGIFFGLDGTTPYINRRTSTSGSAVNNEVTQANWNRDTLDGTGPSGKTFSNDKTQLFRIEFSWLGVNKIKWQLVVEGDVITIHEETFTNIGADAVYMRQAILPVRYKISSSGSVSGSPSLDCICQHVASEGPAVTIGRGRVISTGSSDVGVSSTPELVAGIRLKDENDRLSIQPISFNLLRRDGNDTIYYRVIINPNTSGASGSITWTNLDGIAEGFTNGPTKSGGFKGSDSYIVDEGYILPANGEDASEALDVQSILENDIYIGAGIDGTRDELVIEARRIDGSGTQDLLFVGRYREYF